MRFAITRQVIGCADRIELSRDEFDAVVLARDGFLGVLGIEEKFDLVIQNYAELERGLLDLTMRQMLHINFDYSSFRDDLGLVNRRLVNLLSTCRLYIDQLRHDISQLYGRNSKMFEDVEKFLSTEYELRLGYEILEQLRNHMQHRALPVVALGYHASRDYAGVLSKYRKLTCIPKINLARLREEGVFKKSTIERMEAKEDMLDIRPFVRDYMAGLGTIHAKVRERMDADADRWEALLSGTTDRYRETFGDVVVGLAVVELDDRGCAVRSVQVFASIVDRYRELRKKNYSVSHYDTQFVSSDCDWREGDG